MPQRGVHPLVDADAEQHAYVAEEGGDDDALDDDEAQYAPRTCADGLAYAELVGSLAHGDEHDVAYAHYAAEQGEEPHNPQCGAYDAYAGLHLQVLREAVPQPHGALVVGVGLVCAVQPLPVVGLELLVGLLRGQAVEGELYASGVVGAGAVDALDGGVAAEGVGAPVLVLLVDAHHLEGQAAQVDVSAYEAFGCRLPSGDLQQLLGLFVAQHKHLALHAYVQLVDEASVLHLHLVYLRVVGVDAADAGVDVLLPQADGALRAVLRSHGVDMVGELTGGDVDVAAVQPDAAPLLQPLVGH